MPVRIAVLGAPGTGKSTLCTELASRLRARGHRVLVRVPLRPGEPSWLASTSPEGAPGPDLLIDDGPDAQNLGQCELTLLMGLDLPPSGAQAVGAPTREAIDARLREALLHTGTSWRVIYGQGPERLQQALQAVAAVLPWAWSETAREEDIGRWSRLRASCEKCGDADCEHRLFTGGALGLTAPRT